MNNDKSKKRNPISYSIWLIPNEEEYNILNTIIIDIANRYTNIQFIPHVTLLSGFLGVADDLKSKTKNLAQKITPFNIAFNKITILNEFFRCLFIKIRINHHLENARSLAIKDFSFTDHDFLPHLSLAYGLFDKMIIEEIELFIVEKLKKIDGFYVDTIYLARNDEINYKWNVIEKYRLK